MEPISYARARAACLPMIGPLVTLYNLLEIKREHRFLSEGNELFAARAGLIGLSALFSNPTNALQELERERDEFRNRNLEVLHKGRFYSIFGIVGDVLSLATTIGLIAFKILNVELGIILSLSYTFQAAALSYNLYQHKKTVLALRSA